MAKSGENAPTDVRWICLSDLHLGAENSLLTALRPGSLEPDLDRPSEVLTALAACLRSLIDPDSPPPTLVVAGDLLDLALSPSHVAAGTFEHLAHVVLAGDRPLVDDLIWFVPGNHDHHLWEAARDRAWADAVDRLGADQPVPAEPRTTPLVPGRGRSDAGLLTSLVRRASGRPHAVVQIAYPNLGLQSGDGRMAVVGHGHYAEPIYRLMSRLRQTLFPLQSATSTVARWESDNGAWIDFLWSTLGQSGQVGSDLAVLYDLLQDPAALEAVVDRAVASLTDHGGHPRSRDRATRVVVERMVSLATHHARSRERTRPGGPLSPEASIGLDEWLAGPVRAQLAHEAGVDMPAAIVFGHTHKPFETVRDVAGWAPMPVLNTGGWVIDTLVPDPARGASIVLIGAELDAVAVRVYLQSPDGSGPVVGPVVASAEGAASALAEVTTRRVEAGSDHWQALVEAIDAGTERRRRDLADVIRARGALVPR